MIRTLTFAVLLFCLLSLPLFGQTNQFVYVYYNVDNSSGGYVKGYQATYDGTLTAINTVSTGGTSNYQPPLPYTPRMLAISATARGAMADCAYAVNTDQNSVAGMKINPTTGSLSTAPNSPYAVGDISGGQSMGVQVFNNFVIEVTSDRSVQGTPTFSINTMQIQSDCSLLSKKRYQSPNTTGMEAVTDFSVANTGNGNGNLILPTYFNNNGRGNIYLYDIVTSPPLIGLSFVNEISTDPNSVMGVQPLCGNGVDEPVWYTLERNGANYGSFWFENLSLTFSGWLQSNGSFSLTSETGSYGTSLFIPRLNTNVRMYVVYDTYNPPSDHVGIQQLNYGLTGWNFGPFYDLPPITQGYMDQGYFLGENTTNNFLTILDDEQYPGNSQLWTFKEGTLVVEGASPYSLGITNINRGTVGAWPPSVCQPEN